MVSKVFKYLFALLAGAIFFWGIAWLVGLIFPAAAFWVFCALFAIWAWIGWRYASLKDAVHRQEGTVSTTLNQRLDEMGPRYRAIFGRLTRALAMIEYAASEKPPRMTPAQFETAIELLESSAAELKEAAKDFA
jgi:hypothetical protein